MMAATAALALAGTAGLALGSFAVTCGLRLSTGGSALTGRSRCDGCGRGLSFSETVPILGHLRLRGACAGCGHRIDITHMGGELAGAAVVVASVVTVEPIRAVLVSALGLVLIAAAGTDLKVRRLPDVLTGLAAALALTLSATRSTDAVIAGLAASALTICALLVLRGLSRRRRGDPGLGLGDVKLLGALALWLGLATPWAIAAAAGLGLILMSLTRPTDGRLPFGPALGAGAWGVGLAMEAMAWPTLM